jgi:hypothetical protein
MMEIYMMDNGRMDKDMDKENNYSLMVVYMKDTG